jgi:hypothetical protein
MTEDGGEQPMWRLIGSSHTPRHMAEEEEEASIDSPRESKINMAIKISMSAGNVKCSHHLNIGP